MGLIGFVSRIACCVSPRKSRKGRLPAGPRRRIALGELASFGFVFSGEAGRIIFIRLCGKRGCGGFGV